jgi:hypothetical protein
MEAKFLEPDPNFMSPFKLFPLYCHLLRNGQRLSNPED